MRKLYRVNIGLWYKAEQETVEESEELDGILELLEKLDGNEGIEITYKSFTVSEEEIRNISVDH